jgi:hypothetical protein
VIIIETWTGNWTPLNYEGYEEYLIREGTHPGYGGYTYGFIFNNGYGASVIKHDCSYGNVDDLFELAVLNAYGDIVYIEEIGEDVIGWLTNEEVIEYFERIRRL